MLDTFTPTDEQTHITDLVSTTHSNLLINALAGTGKTTTLDLIRRAAIERPILCLAFNKRIADEMEKRFNDGAVNVRTFNSLGHRIWSKACTGKLTLDQKKTGNLFRAEVDKLSKTDRADAWDIYFEVCRAVSLAKSLGYIPNGKFPAARRLCSQEDFYASLEDRPTDLLVTLVDTILTHSAISSYSGSIDFDDQIYMPTLFGGTFPRYPLVLVDEAQDLSPANHAMLDKLVTGRIIAVGDPWQSIYGFRGARRQGMAALRERFAMREATLSRSFRCPRAIVEAARWRVPEFKWIKEGGRVEEVERLEAGEIEEGAAIICRNNAPLFALAFRLISTKRSVRVAGSDIGPRIVNTLKKLCVVSAVRAEVIDAIWRWREERLASTNAPAAISDIAECMLIFAGFGETLGQAIAYAEHLFSQQGSIQLLTGHKAKGLEWDVVYHLDPWLIGNDDQEKNLRYVIGTRAREKLVMVNSKGIVFDG